MHLFLMMQASMWLILIGLAVDWTPCTALGAIGIVLTYILAAVQVLSETLSQPPRRVELTPSIEIDADNAAELEQAWLRMQARRPQKR